MIRPAPTDPPEVDAVLWKDWNGNVGWDIGSNVGQSIKHMVKAFKMVHAFEPNVDAFNMLQACEYDLDYNVVLHQIAVSDHTGKAILAAIPKLMETGQLATPGTHGMEWDPKTGWDEIPHVTVKCKTVDDLSYDLGIPDFIKVDTEGHEGHIVLGARHVLEYGRTDWLIEFHTPELRLQCMDDLVSADYHVETVRHPHYKEGSHMWYQHGWLRAKAPRGRNA